MTGRLTAEQHYAEGMRALDHERQTSTAESAIHYAMVAAAHFAAATAVQAMAPVAEPPKDVDRCVAHGRAACQNCHLTKPGGLDNDGDCTGCGTYGSTGMHWDTCPNRAYVVLWITDDEAIKAVQALRRPTPEP